MFHVQFDAFAKIDGGGSGRSATDDKRMDLKEWLQGFKGVSDHGFVGLHGISTNEEATEAFGKIDDNGGGIVLLDEWSYYLKNCEIAMGTAVGKLLSLDQEGGVGKKETLFGNTMVKPSVKGVSDLESGMRKLRAFIGKDKKNAVLISNVFNSNEQEVRASGGDASAGLAISLLITELSAHGIDFETREVVSLSSFFIIKVLLFALRFANLQVDAVMSKLDANGDGHISLKEFAVILKASKS